MDKVLGGDNYIAELAGVVALPDRLPRSLLEHARALRVCIMQEQAKPFPNNALIATLCDAARLGWEYIELAHHEYE